MKTTDLSALRIFISCWGALAAAAAVLILALGIRGEPVDLTAIHTWAAFAFALVVAAIATLIPATLLTAALWATRFRGGINELNVRRVRK